MEKVISKIKDMKPGQKNVFINNCEIVETKEIVKSTIGGKEVEICDGKIKDDTGEINISAFGFAAKFLKDSKKINVENCYCKEYNGSLQISTGFYGRIIKIE